MSELSIRRRKIVLQIQKKQRSEYLSKMRQKLLRQWQEMEQRSELEEELYSYLDYLGHCPYLDIYVNLQQLLHQTICINRSSAFAYMLSIYLYITLTSNNEVITYIVETSAGRQWQKINHILKNNSKCQEILYQRMRVLIEFVCAKYIIEPFQTYELNAELKDIFNQRYTSQLLNVALPIDEEAQIFNFLDTYISYMPASHIFPMFTSGFATQILLCSKPNLSLTLLGKMESVRHLFSELDELYNEYSMKILENK